MARKPILASICLEDDLSRAIGIVVDLQGVTVSQYFRNLARSDVIRLGLMENPANKYMPPAPVNPRIIPADGQENSAETTAT